MSEPKVCGECDFWRGCCVLETSRMPLIVYLANDPACPKARPRSFSPLIVADVYNGISLRQFSKEVR